MVDSVLFLGTGGSLGIPVIACECSVCKSTNSKNKRLRPSILLQIDGKNILVDPGTDAREQALKFDIKKLDGVIVTHAHEDHVGGINDLRVYTMRQKADIPLLLSDISMRELKRRFYYIFDEKDQGVVTKFASTILTEDRGSVDFIGIPLKYFSYSQMGLKVTGLRYKDFAYVTDICEYPETIYGDLKGVKTLVISALRHTPTHLHFTVEQAITFAQRVGSKTTYFTHIAHELDHDLTSRLLPEGIHLSYDGLQIFI